MRLELFKNFIIAALFLLLAASAKSQAASGSGYTYEPFDKRMPREKIFVHTDQSFYVCGELIWFKAYVVNAANNEPLAMSSIVYVDLVNDQDQPVLQTKIGIDSSTGAGSFLLPYSLGSGNYMLRAYTNWMKNFEPGDFFTKKISIVNTSVKQDEIVKSKSASITADFLPEGGNMVNGLQSVIAFKAMDEHHKGITCEGVLVDEANDTVARFKSLRFGMGKFTFTPLRGKTYRAIVTSQEGRTVATKLTPALNEGYVMRVDNAGKNDVQIHVSTNLSQPNTGELIVLVQNDGQVTMAKSQRITNQLAVLHISKDSLNEGVSVITVYDSKRRPVAERLFFKMPENRLSLQVNLNKQNYASRDEVQAELSASDMSGKASPGNLSAAVYRLDELHDGDGAGILSYLWLTSFLQGNIENPDYYFDPKNTDAAEAMDNLLLTQGWRKFSTSQAKKPALKYMPEVAGHFITGRITSSATRQPAAGVPVFLSVPGKRIQLRTCISDSMGLIHFEMKDFYGANQVILQTQSQISGSYNIEIFSPYALRGGKYPLPPLSLSEDQNRELSAANFNMAVQHSYHENQLDKFSLPLIDTFPFYYKPDKVYKLDDYRRFTTMEEVMREYVYEVNVRKNGSQFRFETFNTPAFPLRNLQYVQTVFDNNPLVLLDGVPVFDINKIVAYDPLKVERLEVVAQRYHLGTVTAEGVVSYTTYTGNLEGFTLDPDDLVLDYEGLQQQRIFYSPQYNTSAERDSRLPDYRNLLYWSPDVRTNTSGKGSFSFFTGDVPGKYLLVLQGMSANGQAGTASYPFEVTK